MTNKLAELIAKYETELETWNAETDEIDEMKGDDFNPCDWSGGNFDDAYSLGESHSEAFTSAYLISNFIKELEELAKEGR